MPGTFHHEQIYRGADALAKLAQARLTLCGAGALGSNLADNLARQGMTHLRAIDHDRVEEHNVSTQLYGLGDVGVWKVQALRNHVFRATGVEIDAQRKELTDANARQLLRDCDLVLDLFDNSTARSIVQRTCRELGIPCLHVGLNADYAEVVWDEIYRVPRDEAAGDACDYPLARNLVLLAVAVAAEVVVTFLTTGQRDSLTVTLRDLAVRGYEPPVET